MQIELVSAALVFGFLTGFHCIGMCGPIALSLPLKSSSWWARVMSAITYNMGRVATYTFMGLVFGLAGQGLRLAGMQQGLSIVIGVVIILSVLFPLLFDRLLVRLPLFKLVNGVKSRLGLLFGRKTYGALFLVGLLNGLLPCGPVYVAIGLSLAAGSALYGAFYMALFGIGTLPIMLALNLAGNFVSLSLRKSLRKLVPAFMVVLGVWFILKGLGLGVHLISPPEKKLHVPTEQTSTSACCKDSDELNINTNKHSTHEKIYFISSGGSFCGSHQLQFYSDGGKLCL